jgi:hypothetical protein
VQLAVVAFALLEPGRVAAQESPAPEAQDLPTLTAGESFRGTLEATGSVQRFRLGPFDGGLTLSLASHDFDALLRVESETGEPIASDDDGGVETDARIVLERPLALAWTPSRTSAWKWRFRLSALPKRCATTIAPPRPGRMPARSRSQPKSARTRMRRTPAARRAS